MLVLLFIAAIPQYPDPKLTPGATDPAVTQATIQKTICKTGYTKTVRNVSAKMKRQVVEAYLDAHPEWPKCKPVGAYPCEIDHLISLELGGSNELTNLFPEPYCAIKAGGKTCFGAREKDVVETNLRRRVCRGDITLEEAQHIIVTDWLEEYRAIQAGK